MRFGLTEDELWKSAPKATAAIFDFKTAHKEWLSFGFDKGGTGDRDDSAYAVFSRVALSGYGRDELTIQATPHRGDEYSVRHTIKLSTA